MFLDEIGDHPLELQPKLLRTLQEKEVERLGSSRTVKVDIRFIAATNQNLWQLVQDKRFRADLYYRLNVFPMTLPPLREREDDIPRLTEYFVQKFANQQGKSIDTIPDEVMLALQHYDWPGNIRELQNVIERGVIITTGPALSRRTTEPLKSVGATPSNKTLAEVERAHITTTLNKTNWVVGGPHGAAAQLGLPRTTLLARMRRLGISNGTSRNRSGQSTGPFVRVMSGRVLNFERRASGYLTSDGSVAG